MTEPVIERTMPYAAGYRGPDYCAALSDVGVPEPLPGSGGWLLRRAIPGTAGHDLMGPYPVFCCSDWEALPADLDSLDSTAVSVALVADPFGRHDEKLLRRCFPDACRVYKQHFIVDLSLKPSEFMSEHHRRNVKKVSGLFDVEVAAEPWAHLDEWVALYDNLIARHAIQGIAAFSRRSFELQLRVPGMVMFRATKDGLAAGVLLWYAQGDTAYYHLGAYTDEGYRLKASFALFSAAIDYFASNGIKWLNLGAGAGVHGDPTDGLTRFKKGWSTGTRAAYFCGLILDKRRYGELTVAMGASTNGYFPAYRGGGQ